MVTIKKIIGYEILSSGGDPTVEATVLLSNGMSASASVPFGASDGTHEAFILLDKDQRRYRGKGMLKAAKNISTTLSTVLKGKSIAQPRALDLLMLQKDGTQNKTSLGGNAILAVSIAIARAGALAAKKPLYSYLRTAYKLRFKGWKLPKPMMVTIEGGRHADNSTDLQEYMLTPIANLKRRELVRMGIECYMAVKDILKEKNLSINVGNEGAFTPHLPNNESPLPILVEGIKRAGFVPGKDVAISLDPAASELFKNGWYHLALDKKTFSSNDMTALFSRWIATYPIVTLEDPLHEDDWKGWSSLFQILHEKVRIVGDDLTVTNPKRLQQAIDTKSIDTILIKPNQIGTVSETLDTCSLAFRNGLDTIISHRGGGETGDTFIMDLGVAVNALYYKVGATRGERTEKYNRLLAIEHELE